MPSCAAGASRASGLADNPPVDPHAHSHERSPRSYAVLSIGAAVATIGMKIAAYRITGSIGLLSDAAETAVNLVAAIVAYWALTVASRPPDEEHAFGHSKAEYFASG